MTYIPIGISRKKIEKFRPEGTCLLNARCRAEFLTDFKILWQKPLLDALDVLKGDPIRYDVCRSFGTTLTGKSHEKT